MPGETGDDRRHVGIDSIYGTPGPDVIVALGSQDQNFGGGGADRICGGDGNDSNPGR